MKANVFYVITKTQIIDPLARDNAIQLVKKSLPIFRKQSGLITIHVLISHDDSHLTTFMIWEDEASHLQCMQSPDFALVNPLWEKLLQEGKIKFTLNTYDKITY